MVRNYVYSEHPIVKMANPEYKNFKFDLPPADVAWSGWYKEQDDAFQDFSTFAAPSSAQLTPQRTLSARQISGQFEDEVAKCWEEDWEDEDVEDTYDAVMGKIGRASASAAAASSNSKP